MPSSSFARLDDDFEVVSSSKGANARSSYDPKIDWETYASKYLEFTDHNPTAFHAVDYLRSEFEKNGFKYLSERESWDEALEEGSRFITTRNGSSFIAWVKGKHWKPTNGAVLTAAHTDSLQLTIKPVSNRENIDGYELLGIAPYSGSLNKTWWDRDLGVGGRLVVRDGKAFKTKLVRLPHPVARIPTLAPHFGLPDNGPYNLETQLVPVIGIVPADGVPEPTDEEKKSPVVGQHPLRLLRAVAKEAGIELKDVIEIELHLYDTQPASFGGLDKEFLFAPRIDDKICTYAASYGLIESADAIEAGHGLAIVGGFDNEEIGSLSRQGAQGNLLDAVVDRVLDGSASEQHVFWANSFFLSADVSHAVNPNFTSVYLEHHKPLLNVGLVLSHEPNGRMITNAVSAAVVHEVARRTGDKLQNFQIRNDSRSGGTIGPYISSRTGVRGVDIGIPQLSMHSIRATTGSKDVYLGVRFFKNFNELYNDIDLAFKFGDL